MSRLLVGVAVASSILMVGCSADLEVDNSKQSQTESSKEGRIVSSATKRRADAAALEAKRDVETEDEVIVNRLEVSAQNLMRELLASPQFLTNYNQMKADCGGKNPRIAVNRLLNKTRRRMPYLGVVEASICEVLSQSEKFDVIAKDGMIGKNSESPDFKVVGDIQSLVESVGNHVYYLSISLISAKTGIVVWAGREELRLR